MIKIRVDAKGGSGFVARTGIRTLDVSHCRRF